MKSIKLKKVLIKRSGTYEKNGFVLVSFLVLIPFLLAGIFSYASLIQIIDIKTKQESLCLKIQNQSFHRQRKRIQKLFDLNPRAESLISKKAVLKAKITAATAAGQLELAAILTLKLGKVIAQQEKLALKQKQILLQADEEFLRSDRDISKKLSKSGLEIRSKSTVPWNINFGKIASNYPTLAVEPTIADLAPPYKLKSNFPEKQSWQLNWIMNIGAGPQLAAFIKFNYEVKQKCSLTLMQKGRGFSIIVPDKFLLN